MTELDRITIRGHALEYRLLPGRRPDGPVIVLLHEGLGAVELWRDFPEALAAATGCSLLVWSRYGFGGSDPLREPRTARYLHEEALEALPELLDKLEIVRPLLVGHSDGATIALLHAALAERPIAGLVAMAPHVFVEEISLAGIRAAGKAFFEGDLAGRMARYHRDAEATFRGWHDIWLSPEFRDWNIEDCLPRITAPVLLIQGEDDEYGTMAQIDAIEAGVSGPCRRLDLPGCGHNPHRECEAEVLAAITAFIDDFARKGEDD
ncbi:alpha/beta fold hydrolase [Aquibaculum sediminis]|uniref:alpha/beta fold hydrolase n=1 Tax=Aquibaculum sediminis TaxID=3231907 RepID=UPI003456DE7C